MPRRLGKLLVKGPDAGKFLDMLYTNMMSTLKPGKCRYGLMCSENGFLIDDGVVARIDERDFLCHTTTGGADHPRSHGRMASNRMVGLERLRRQCHRAIRPESLLLGPTPVKLLEMLGGMDVSADAFGFMEWQDGTLGGFDVRAYRISFSGELSYEIAVPASQGQAFWDALMAVGADLGVMPYGTECLHIYAGRKGLYHDRG